MNDSRLGEALDRENDRRLGVYLRDEDDPDEEDEIENGPDIPNEEFGDL